MTPQNMTFTERLIERLAKAQVPSILTADTLGRKLRKIFLDPLANFLGKMTGWILLLGGTRLLFKTHEIVLRRVNPTHLQALAPSSKSHQKEIFELLREFKKMKSQDCSFLILFSHPEGGKKMQMFSLALYHQVFQTGRLLHSAGLAKGYPRFLVAVDPFALDTLNWISGNFYAGFANTIHVSLDRQPSRLNWIQRHILLRKSAPSEAGFKFLNRLKPGHVMALAQAGGEPQNARLLYTAREFVSRLGKKYPGLNKEAFVSILSETSLDSGLLSREKKSALSGLLAVAGIPPGKISGLCRDFEEEFRRHTPYRERLFHILLDRILKKQVPLMLISLWHDWGKETLHLGKPEILWQTGAGERKRFYLKKNSEIREESISHISAYAKNFTSAHFPK